MLLKSVDIFGFKSFADKTRIEFSRGVSALLGPNGCGKSNVVDAIKWSLGEQAARSLRADRMEDVIFSGTEQRKAVNVAEVVLTLENDDGMLAIDLPEIEVRRRLFRSGESEYAINGKQVKLKDIRELFYDTGIGKSAYSIMEQGRIDQILSNKPEDRRYIFEEAAGITKFIARGAEAERKLAKTEDNMARIEDILSEVKKRYETLRKQSEKTIRYRTIREEIFEREVDLQLLKLKSIRSDRRSRKEELEKRQAAYQEMDGKIREIEDTMETDLDEVNKLESRLADTQRRIYQVDMEYSNIETQVGITEERVGEIERSIDSEHKRAESARKKLEALQKELNERLDEIETTKGQLDTIAGNITEFTEAIDANTERIEHRKARITEMEKRITDAEAEREQLHHTLRSLTDDIVAELDRGLRETGYSLTRHQEIDQRIHNTYQSVKISVQGKIELIRDSIALQGERAKENLETALSGMEDIQQLLKDFEEELNELRNMIPSFLDSLLAPEGIMTKKREIDGRLSDISSIIHNAQSEISELREENERSSAKNAEYRRTLEELRVNQAHVRTRYENLKDQYERDQRESEERTKTLEQTKAGIKQFEERLAKMTEENAERRKRLAELQKQRKELEKETQTYRSGISGRNKDLNKRESSLRKQREQLQQIQGKLESVQLQIAQLETREKDIFENFEERHSRSLEEFEKRLFDISDSEADIRDAVRDLKGELKSLGQVNLMAPEEFREVEERYKFLNDQLEDLRKARKDLEEVTREIREESTERFMETYNRIKQNFHLMFRRLFGGGRAELILDDPEQVLETGIDIFAQPPGKKLENIALLSGGERSLTAIALLFATYMVKPSPFCILDEIDAALDESNVGRFVNLLMEFGRTSQFIVITHNKKTIAAASTMLGVTMEESGVSKIVAIRLDKEAVAVE
ncbi:MAG: AAA family ATPase [Spirochaetales bacterium]|nr:AAA family ATPase [Spirochaetales bacterium]MCF7937445.1 AAA family ATPase [Spirochaetales bacterium]